VLNVFVKRDWIYYTYVTELFFIPVDPGQHRRRVDPISPPWIMLDYTPTAHGATGIPKFK
jgi:hypothetical protein